MIVWGGVDSTFNDANTGGAYNPAADSWVASTTNNAPSARDSHTAVWTGSEMIVWEVFFAARRSILTQVEGMTLALTVGQPPAPQTHLLHDGLTRQCGPAAKCWCGVVTTIPAISS
jgi:hypothetical protein